VNINKADMRQCDICQGRQICNICGNKVSRAIEEMDFLDMHFAGATFCTMMMELGEVYCISYTPTLDEIVQFCKTLKSCKAIRKGPVFLKRAESTYDDFFPDSRYIVESEMITDIEEGRFRRIVAYLNKEVTCAVD
jgi:hypothetical protein